MPALKFGVVLPYIDARAAARLAQAAEAAGWDGVFVGDAIWCQDPLIQLTAAAMVTSRIRLATMVLAMPLRDPRHLASESLAIDILSNGRLTLGLAMGATWMGWQSFPQFATDAKSRAERLDESIDILTLLQLGKPFDYDGKHNIVRLTQLDEMYYPPKPVQQPRVPIWVPAVVGRKNSMQRLLKVDGVFPQKMNAEGQFVEVAPEDVSQIKEYVDANRTLTTPFDIVVEGKTGDQSPEQAREKLAAWAEAGATWWVESTWDANEVDLEARIRVGPTREK